MTKVTVKPELKPSTYGTDRLGCSHHVLHMTGSKALATRGGGKKIPSKVRIPSHVFFTRALPMRTVYILGTGDTEGGHFTTRKKTDSYRPIKP